MLDGIGYGGVAGILPGGEAAGGLDPLLDPPQSSPLHSDGGELEPPGGEPPGGEPPDDEPPQSSLLHSDGGGLDDDDPPQSSPVHSGGDPPIPPVGVAGLLPGPVGAGALFGGPGVPS
jgi:hypothetical protein